MKVLIIHPNFPGQYKHIARVLGSHPENKVVFACKPKQTGDIHGVRRVEYSATREPANGIHPYIVGFERAVLQGQAMWRICEQMKRGGFTPDVICAHPGWGEGLFLKDIYPDVPVLFFMEFYYHAFGADVYFDPKEEVNPNDVCRIRVKNSTNLFNLEACDWAITPTFWQKNVHPPEFHYKMSVLHDGIDTNVITPLKKGALTLPNGVVLQQGDEVVTYVARNFEPYRGFPTIMRGIDLITKRRKNCHVLVIGSEGVSYGRHPEDGKSYKQQMLEELDLDMSRVHFLGHLPYSQYLTALQFSKTHIYYTVPFVLSWSMLEAMASGCAVVASNTKPVMEVITDGHNGLLADFFSHEDLANRVEEVLDHPDGMQQMRQAARQTILDHYSLDKVLPLHLSLIKDLAERRMPPPTAQAILACNPAPASDMVFVDEGRKLR